MKAQKQGSVILLNGVSSSGKSTIIKELIALNSELKVLKVDDWFPDVLKKTVKGYGWKEDSVIDPWMYLYDYAFKKTGKYYFNTEIREQFFNNSFEFYQQAEKLVDMGYDVVIDTVLEFDREYQQCDDFFKNINLKKILIYCPLDIVSQRVAKRNKSGIMQEQRTLFQSFEQFVAMFRVQDSLHEEVVDKVKTSTIRQVLDDAIQQLLDNNIPEPYLVKLEEFKAMFTEKFKLHDQDVVSLSLHHPHDAIFNSYVNTPRDLAKKILAVIS